MQTSGQPTSTSRVSLTKFFKGASGAFAVLPGFALLVTGLGVPPGYRFLFFGVLEAFGILALLLVYLNRSYIQRMSKKSITSVAIVLAVCALMSIIVYVPLHNLCLIESTKPEYDGFGAIYFPICVTGTLADNVQRLGSRTAAVDGYGPAVIEEQLQRMSGISWRRPVTTIVLLLIYQACFTVLTIAFGLIGFYEGADLFSPTND